MPRVQNGVIWMIIATFFFAFMGMFVKLGSPYFSEIELVFYRSFISLIFIILIIVNKKISLKTNFKKLHFYRSFVGFLSLLAFFYAISHLPLSTAISLNYTSPLFVALLIPFFLHKKPSFYVCYLLLIGFFGAFLISKTRSGWKRCVCRLYWSVIWIRCWPCLFVYGSTRTSKRT